MSNNCKGIKGSGKCLKIFLYLFACAIFVIILLYKKSSDATFYKGQYESISSFNFEILNKIKSNKDIKNLDENTKDDLSFKFVKFADLGYKKRSKKKRKFFS